MPLHLNKPALRVLGIAESFLRARADSRLAGVVMRADRRVDGLAFARATVGGDDATDGVLRIYERLDRSDINALLLSGAAVSWFNIIDLQEVFAALRLPVICLTYEESPGLERYIRQYLTAPEEKLRRRYRVLRVVRRLLTQKILCQSLQRGGSETLGERSRASR